MYSGCVASTRNCERMAVRVIQRRPRLFAVTCTGKPIGAQERMAQANSISFDDVLGLLRGPLVSAFEANYVASRRYIISEDWGDSLNLTKELAFARATRVCIEETLVSRSNLLGKFMDALMLLPDGGEEWPEGEQPDELPQAIASDEPIRLGRGFSIMAACSIWMLTERSGPELVSWLKFRRIPYHKRYAQDLREIFGLCTG